MEFFDKLGKKASETYKFTAEKTGKLAKEAKLRMKINDDKEEIEELYQKIGEKVYQKHVRQENIDIKEELEEECTKIDVLTAEIETTLKECMGLRDKKKCENCHSEIDKDAKFCPNCGAKQEEQEDEEEPAKEPEILPNSENADTQGEEEH